MIKSLKYILILPLFLISCINPKSILPRELKLKKVQKEYLFSYYIYEYDVLNNNVELGQLNDSQIRCKRDHKSCCEFNWKIYRDIDQSTKLDVIEFLNFLGKGDNQIISSITERINQNQDIYFSGCYKKMYINQKKTVPSWEYRFFLDTENKKLYVIDYTEDFLLPGIPNPF
jgi:hypothetical protein